MQKLLLISVFQSHDPHVPADVISISRADIERFQLGGKLRFHGQTQKMDVQQDVNNVGRGELLFDKSKIFGKKDAVKSILYCIDPEVPIQNIRRLAREVCDQKLAWREGGTARRVWLEGDDAVFTTVNGGVDNVSISPAIVTCSQCVLKFGVSICQSGELFNGNAGYGAGG